jgi:hypothetical protein
VQLAAGGAQGRRARGGLRRRPRARRAAARPDLRLLLRAPRAAGQLCALPIRGAPPLRTAAALHAPPPSGTPASFRRRSSGSAGTSRSTFRRWHTLATWTIPA